VVAADALPTQYDHAYYCAELSLLHVAVLVSQSSYAHDKAMENPKIIAITEKVEVEHKSRW
jgi:hypothetical protein